MKKHKGKTKRWLAGILSAVLVIGSINLVDALEGSNGESALYDAPELTITKGAETYDLKEGITYDSSMYELAVVNEGGFDVNTVGDYEVTYSLTSKDDGTLEPENPGDTSDADNENKDQNSGDNQGSDNTQTGDNTDASGSGSNTDNTDNTDSSDSSDSSNAGDNADAGQGDTNSDSSNAGDSSAGDSADSADNSSAGDNTDAGAVESAAEGGQIINDAEVPRTASPEMATVAVPEGEGTNTGDTQEKQVITFTRMVHVVVPAPDDEIPVYEARELVLTQGEEDYDLTDDILYDDVKYTLTVGDLGGFDINKIGSYEVTYSLTPVTTEGTQGNGQNDAQENQVITFQRTVTVKAAVEENALYEAPDLYLEWGQEDYDLTEGIIYDKDLYEVKVSDPGDFDIYTLGEYEVTYVLDRLGKSAKAEDTQTSKTEETTASNEDTDNTQTAALELTDEKQSVDPADGDTTSSMEEKTSEVKTASQEAVYFTRNVIVEESGVTYSFRNAVTYANVQGNYTVELGAPVWTDDTHTKFQYTNVKIDTNGDDISLMTIQLSKAAMSQDILKDATFKDSNGKQATWIFAPSKNVEQLQQQIREMVFDYSVDEQIDIVINGNETTGLDGKSGELLRWKVNGHYYLYFNEVTSWSKAYNKAMDYKLAGMQGYLATVVSKEEAVYLLNLTTNNSWVCATRLVKSDGTLLNNDRIDPLASGTLKYRSNLHINNNNSPYVLQARKDYYWAAGPEAGTNTIDWRDSAGVREPNELASPVSDDNTLADVQGYESCGILAYTNYGTGIYDYKEGNSGSGIKGYFVEFGGYADGTDPGGVNNGKQGEVSENVAPKEAEAVVNYS